MKTVEGAELSDKQLSVLEPGESLTFAARPDYATVGMGAHWSSPLLLLTDQRLILSKDRLFGRPRADHAVSWPHVETVEGSLWNGGGPKIQLIVSTSSHSIEMIVQPLYAVEVESAVRGGYMRLR